LHNNYEPTFDASEGSWQGFGLAGGSVEWMNKAFCGAGGFLYKK